MNSWNASGPVAPLAGPRGSAGGWLSDDDLHWFNEGTHYRLYEPLGAHPARVAGAAGTRLAVWAPNAESVSVMGSFNGWDRRGLRMEPVGTSGIWAAFVPAVGLGALYKYHIVSRYRDYRVDKPDPIGFCHEQALRGASIVWDLDYPWRDDAWMAGRAGRCSPETPISIYEVHLGSWMRVPEEGNRFLTYRELADRLTRHVLEVGFTHVEFMPVMEHPFYGSWGYQITGYFAPTGRYGTPHDFMYLVDCLHQAGIGVILDWVPSHFATDEHGLGFFDGTHLYEHADPRQGRHPDWDSWIFNYGRREVQSFLISNALFWLDRYHADGLRVDAVASMLYLDYSRRQGEWLPNEQGGRENLQAIHFLRNLNEQVAACCPGALMFAEESTAFPMVSRPTRIGGLGFDYKWDMGWMHDTLHYLALDPLFRCHHHRDITFRMMYAFSENFALPLSHDEVVHGKGSLPGKMPGDEWRRFANLRLLFAWMFGQPGKKLLFMGGEFGQPHEWDHDTSLDWHVAGLRAHAGLRAWVCALNRFYRDVPAMHRLDADPAGFEWMDCGDAERSAVFFVRKSRRPGDLVLAVYNFTPVPLPGYRVGVPAAGFWAEALNSDAAEFGGSGLTNGAGTVAEALPVHGRTHSLSLTLPPLGAAFLRPDVQ